MANGAVNLRIDVLFVACLFRERLLVPILWRFPVQLGDEFFGPQMGIRVAVTFDAPGHRKLFVLVDNFHLVDATVATLATHSRVHVGRVIEVDELRQVVNALPTDALAGLPTLVNRCQLFTFGVNRRQRRDPLIVGRTVAVDAGRRWRDRRMRRLEDGVVTVPAIQL